jgi:hypothetical protein
LPQLLRPDEGELGLDDELLDGLELRSLGGVLERGLDVELDELLGLGELLELDELGERLDESGALEEELVLVLELLFASRSDVVERALSLRLGVLAVRFELFGLVVDELRSVPLVP